MVSTHVWRQFLLVCSLLLALVAVGSAQAPRMSGEKTKWFPAPDAEGRRPYMISLTDAPIASYMGEVEGLAATCPARTGVRKLNTKSTASQAYRSFLDDKRADAQVSIEKACGRTVVLRREYAVVFNGMAVSLTTAEAARVKKLPGILRVEPEMIQRMETDNGPAWIGADDLWVGDAGLSMPGAQGEGIIVGVIDTGINPLNPSFADVGGDGYDHTNPLGAGTYLGVGNPADPNYDPSFPLNDKLIGAYDFTTGGGYSAYDDDGHGSHTGSTAAGNHLTDVNVVSPTTTFTRSISGVAPHANIVSYRALEGGSGSTSDLVAAIEQATIDQVDVINYSIGGGSSDPWARPTATAFLNAREAGVFAATSAGNSGPGAETMGSPGDAPWILTVGASTHDRLLLNRLGSMTSDAGAGPPQIEGKGMTAPYGPAPIVYAGDYPNANDPGGDPAQALQPFPVGTWTSGEIVVVDRGSISRVAKGENVLAGGAGGFILANGAANAKALRADHHALPGVHITYADGVTLKNWLATGTGHQGIITGLTISLTANYGDIMGDFSSRGPNPSVPTVLKPDVTAPGVDIIAAGGTGGAADVFEAMGGTSMASPHAAGAAALIRQLHPSWTPDEIQSALTTTGARPLLKEDEATTADPFDRGGGRVQAFQAAQAGLLLDETYADYVAADPLIGGDPSNLNLATLCGEGVWEREWTRTVTSANPITATWQTSFTHPTNVTLSTDPTSFSLAPGASQTVTITADLSGVPEGEMAIWKFGDVTFWADSANTPDTTLPAALQSMASTLPDSIRVTGASQTGSVLEQDIRALEITQWTAQSCGLVTATLDQGDVYQDPTNGSPYDIWPPAPTDGVITFVHTVPTGTKRLVTEIVQTTAPDLDLYILRYNGSGYDAIASAQSTSAYEYISLMDPTPGEYTFVIQNWLATDPSGATADQVTLAVGIVPSTNSGNMAAFEGTGATAVTGNQPFDMKVAWYVTDPGQYYYGVLSLGTDAANPGNLGSVAVDIHLATALPGSFFSASQRLNVEADGQSGIYTWNFSTASDSWYDDTGNYAFPITLNRSTWLGLYLYDYGSSSWSHAVYPYRQDW